MKLSAATALAVYFSAGALAAPGQMKGANVGTPKHDRRGELSMNRESGATPPKQDKAHSSEAAPGAPKPISKRCEALNYDVQEVERRGLSCSGKTRAIAARSESAGPPAKDPKLDIVPPSEVNTKMTNPSSPSTRSKFTAGFAGAERESQSLGAPKNRMANITGGSADSRLAENPPKNRMTHLNESPSTNMKLAQEGDDDSESSDSDDMGTSSKMTSFGDSAANRRMTNLTNSRSTSMKLVQEGDDDSESSDSDDVGASSKMTSFGNPATKSKLATERGGSPGSKMWEKRIANVKDAPVNSKLVAQAEGGDKTKGSDKKSESG
ncbi:hypothetical protein CDD83_2644 [Cordyceps sp. RAO-2017]|nr:hypothetical protein CDD83_2644 [Cordyceps sp. RAO-2017]